MSDVCYKCHHDLECIAYEGLHSECFSKWFNVSSPLKFEYVAKDCFFQSGEDSDLKIISCFHGNFRKYSARLGDRKYILKFGEEDFPELPKTEFLSNQLAQLIGLPVPKHFLISYNNESDAFVSYNFMQDYPRSDLVHIYRFLEKPQDFSCTGLINVLKCNLAQISQGESINQFIRLTLFDSLFGNDDRHGRNLGLIQTPKGYCLAPFYDNPSHIGIESPRFLRFQLNPIGAIPTDSTDEPTMKDYADQWCRLGYSSLVVAFQLLIKQLEPQIMGMIDSSFISDARKLAMKTLFETRSTELYGVDFNAKY